jgi:MFS transporter, DHA2 family, multidrug resistance protein
MDVFSAVLSLGAVLGVIYGLKRMAEAGLGWAPVAAVVAGLALGAAFVARQRRLADPLIDLRLFRVPAFSGALAAYTLATFVGFGGYVFIAQYLQLVLGLEPLPAGLWTVPSMLAYIAGSFLVPRIARRVHPARVMCVGMLVAAGGFALLTQVDGPAALPVIVAGSVTYSLGLSPVVILATDLIVGSAPVERAGAAAAISETSSELGGALGIALLGSAGIAVYRLHMADAMPAGVPPDAAEAARGTLGAAVAAAARLPDPMGSELVAAAREAFTRSFETAAAVNAALAVATALVAAVLLRRASGGPAA